MKVSFERTINNKIIYISCDKDINIEIQKYDTKIFLNIVNSNIFINNNYSGLPLDGSINFITIQNEDEIKHKKKTYSFKFKNICIHLTIYKTINTGLKHYKYRKCKYFINIILNTIQNIKLNLI
uniref:Uncharacterized protein n=1 Tax=Pichia etchellsii TaxID=28550 RepID=Q9C128_PICET|nr:hypothetical protein [Schwanniomyces etchellsii]